MNRYKESDRKAGLSVSAWDRPRFSPTKYVVAQILLDNSASGCTVSTHLSSFSLPVPSPKGNLGILIKHSEEEPNDDEVLCKTVRSGRNAGCDRPCGHVD